MAAAPGLLSIEQIKSRVFTSFVTLALRSLVLLLISSVVSYVFLTRYLPPEIVGIFYIANNVVIFLSYFSDIGLGAALIQKSGEVTHDDIKTTFTIQELLVISISLLLIVTAPLIVQFYNLPESTVWLVRSLGIAFFLSSLKVIPAVMLERHLRFGPLVTTEVVETLTYNSLLVLLVLQGWTIEAFTVAVLGRSIVGVVIIYLLAPVKLGIGIVRSSAKELFRFGVPFQLNSLLALGKDRLVPLTVAKIIGPTGVGYATWAEGLSLAPLSIMSLIIRITFPAFARLQHDKAKLAVAVEKSLFVTAVIVYPLLFGIGAVLPSLVTYIINHRWIDAVPSYYLFAFAAGFSVISTTFTNTLNSTGHIKTTLKLMIMWTSLTWLLTPTLSWFYGFVGVAVAAFVISFTSIITIIIIKRHLQLSVLRAVSWPLICSLLMAGIVYLICLNWVRDWFSLSITIGIGGLVYISSLGVVAGRRIIADIRVLRVATKE